MIEDLHGPDFASCCTSLEVLREGLQSCHRTIRRDFECLPPSDSPRYDNRVVPPTVKHC